MHNSAIRVLALALGVMVFFYAPDTFAAGDIVNRGHGMLDFISQRLGPIIIGLGIVGGGGALAFGIPGAIQKLISVVVGGILITSVASVIGLIQGF